jgi:hypothetical protein
MAYLNIGVYAMRTSATILLLTLLVLGSRAAIATNCAGGTTCCDRCGRHTACVEKACQVVCEVKKETKTCWCVECQEICPLMPGHHDGCCDCPPPPRCGHPKCVKKLVKKEYQVEVPVYKCVVLHLCPECANGKSTELPVSSPKPSPAPTTAPMPPAPIPSPPSNAK